MADTVVAMPLDLLQENFAEQTTKTLKVLVHFQTSYVCERTFSALCLKKLSGIPRIRNKTIYFKYYTGYNSTCKRSADQRKENILDRILTCDEKWVYTTTIQAVKEGGQHPRNQQELWFQQDGATCHTARATIDLLKDTLGDRLISRFGPMNWPPRSCDLTPLDYFLWGYVKSLVYADKPQTLDHLEDNIRRVIADIRPQMLEKVIENWTSRLDYIRASRGSPMPELILKMLPLRAGPGLPTPSAGPAACWSCDLPDLRSSVLSHCKIHCLHRVKMNSSWRDPPPHHSYAAEIPALSLQCRRSRAHQTHLARFRSGHLRGVTFVQGVKSFFTCPYSLPASSAHLLNCCAFPGTVIWRSRYGLRHS
ncbi:uncharacterized protein TNCV_1320371 [Trichonephila clavipes]|nr:uncharacterized protein TNCV_1320371 [Trichonephila clavipes]